MDPYSSLFFRVRMLYFYLKRGGGGQNVSSHLLLFIILIVFCGHLGFTTIRLAVLFVLVVVIVVVVVVLAVTILQPKEEWAIPTRRNQLTCIPTHDELFLVCNIAIMYCFA